MQIILSTCQPAPLYHYFDLLSCSRLKSWYTVFEQSQQEANLDCGINLPLYLGNTKPDHTAQALDAR